MKTHTAKPLSDLCHRTTVLILCTLVLMFAFSSLSAQSVKNNVQLTNAPSDILINEFQASNTTTLIDEDGDYSDWLELFNSGATTVDLTGWYLSDDSTNLKKWQFPAISLPAGNYLIVFASNKNRTTPLLHTNFKLTAEGEFLALTQPDTTQIVSEYRPAFPLQVSGVSFGNLAGSASYFSTPSPGAVNAAGTITLALSDSTVNEDSPNDTYIGSFITTDIDTATSATYSIVDDAGGRFKVVGNALQVADSSLLDFAVDTSHAITARSTYGGGTTVDRIFTVFIENQVSMMDLEISEVMASNATTLQDEDGDYSDWIEIHNIASTALDLNNWYLTDDSTSLTKWQFPAISLDVGEYLIVFASGKDRDVGELHTNFKLSSSGEYLGLVQPDTTLIAAEFRPDYPLQITDISLGNVGSTIYFFDSPTPGTANSVGTVDLALSDNSVGEESPNDTYIGTLITTDLDTATSVTYSLTDDAGGRFKVVGNEVQVANSSLLDFATDSTHQITARSTYNGSTTVDKTLTINVEQLYTTSLEVSEFMASNGTILQDEDNEYSDWIEIRNTGSSSVDLEDWYITDDDGELDKWQFPSVVIPAGGYLVLFASNKDRTGAELHTNFKLGAGGEYLGLVQPNGSIVVSEYTPEYPEQSEDVSYGIFNSSAQFFTTPTPGSANTDGTLPIDPLTISPERGYYSSSFDVTITGTTPGTEIRYTLDGSKPTPSNGSIYSGPITVDTTTVLRAAAYKTGFIPSNVETNTYLFLNYVIEQPHSIPGYPVNNYSVAGSDVAPHDYEMDPNIVDDPAYSGDIIKGLQDIPSMLITVDPDSLFGANHFYDELDVEQRISLEYLDFNNPDRNEQLECGIEGHSHLRLKRSLRLSFRSEYGTSSWRTNIFKDAPLNGNSADKDQKRIVLRAGNNRSWARKWNPEETTHTEDQWFRDTRIAMSGHGSHGNFVHLYINGIYWGLYNPVERPDHHFSAEYFGGDSEDWYAHNHSGTISGDGNRFDYLEEDLVEDDMTDSTKYAEMQEYLDFENFIDYMMLSWYGAVTDWPGKNYWGGMRNTPAGPFMFYNWDAEWSWDVTKDYPSVSGAWVHPFHRVGENEDDIHSNLWHALRQNDDFMALFADRIYLHCFNSGALTDSSSLARWDTLNAYVFDAMIAESAKWGDCQISLGEDRHTRDLHWQDEVDLIRGLMDGNTAQFITALRAEGYYPDIDPPTFNQRGGDVNHGFDLTLTNPNGSGTVYYTTDGTDPRASNGVVSASAVVYSSAITLTADTTINVRVLDGSEWSAKDEVTFDVAPSTTVNLRVKLFLEGAYDSGTGEMSATLNTSGYLPLASPYHENPRSVLTMPDDITDWVLIELRSAHDGSALNTRSVLLRKDGLVVGDDGTTEYVTMDSPAGSYYVVIKHRNHLAIMSTSSQSLSSSSTLYDFTSSLSTAYTAGSSAMQDLGSGVYGLYAADANGDGQITSSDFNTFLPAARTAQSGYHLADWNLDGQITSSDFNFFNPNAKTAAQTQVPGGTLKMEPQEIIEEIKEFNHAN
ncbi:MAG: lamin tail domain-containing protein [Calditrichia bacterium]